MRLKDRVRESEGREIEYNYGKEATVGYLELVCCFEAAPH